MGENLWRNCSNVYLPEGVRKLGGGEPNEDSDFITETLVKALLHAGRRNSADALLPKPTSAHWDPKSLRSSGTKSRVRCGTCLKLKKTGKMGIVLSPTKQERENKERLQTGM